MYNVHTFANDFSNSFTNCNADETSGCSLKEWNGGFSVIELL